MEQRVSGRAARGLAVFGSIPESRRQSPGVRRGVESREDEDGRRVRRCAGWRGWDDGKEEDLQVQLGRLSKAR